MKSLRHCEVGGGNSDFSITSIAKQVPKLSVFLILLLVPTVLIACVSYRSSPVGCKSAVQPGTADESVDHVSGETGVGIELAFPNLRFRELTNLMQPNDGTDRIFVTEHDGCIHVFPNDSDVDDSTVFLDLASKVRILDEDGLMGMTFDPDYEDNGLFYVFYTADKHHRSVLSRFKVSGKKSDRADADSEQVILEIPKPAKNHNGGKLMFGPDGYLYIQTGDGQGGSNKSLSNGQNLSTLLSSVLRIDVNGLDDPSDYRIPSDNPYVDVPGARDEIWAKGFRSPWGASFDPASGLLWLTDVGTNRWEEINIIEKGGNYGWDTMEGHECLAVEHDGNPNCDRSGLLLPIFTYSHQIGCAAMGGFHYQGEDVSSLNGSYVFGDYCTGQVWAIWYDGQSVVRHDLLVNSGLSITSFGEDLEGNIYLLDAGGLYHFGGVENLSEIYTSAIYKLVETQ